MLGPLLLVAPAVLGFALPASPPSDVLLRVRVSSMNKPALATWLQRRGFAAVLPIQPMLIKPLEEPLCGLELTFRRKPNSEKGGQDGGLRFALSDDADDDSCGQLLVTRISEGQYCDKAFSEKLILKKVVNDLANLPSECGEVLSVINAASEPSS
jgi:hypothetical protein